MIHRDIKPGNIAFTSDGDVKIMDFGIALNIEATGRLTKTGHILGTPITWPGTDIGPGVDVPYRHLCPGHNPVRDAHRPSPL